MDLVLLFSLPLWWTAVASPRGPYKPWLIVDSEVEDGDTVKVTCTLPIDYSGGNCRLFRGNSKTPFKLKTAEGFICVFHLSTQELLGKRLVGSRVYIRCDYVLQQFTSDLSDIKGVTVWGSSPSPVLSISRRFLSPKDGVQVTCSPPLSHVSSCQFYRGQVVIADGSCNRTMTGEQLGIWEKPALLLPVNMTCTYHPYQHRHFHSGPSNHRLLFVVDQSQASSSVNCTVSVDDDDDQLAAFRDDSWTSVGADGLIVTVQMTNSSLMPSEPCSSIRTTQSRP